ETRPEKGGNRVWVGAQDGQPAAPLGSARREARDQDEAARFYGLPDSVRIGGPVPVLRQEVQDRPVVPEVNGEVRLPAREVGHDEADCPPLVTKACLCPCQSG